MDVRVANTAVMQFKLNIEVSNFRPINLEGCELFTVGFDTPCGLLVFVVCNRKDWHRSLTLRVVFFL